MTNRFQVRRSNEPGKAPDIIDLLLGELAFNLADKNLFISTGGEVVHLNAASSIKQDSDHRFVSDAQINVWNAGYTLPTATATVLGGVKVGANLYMDNGAIGVDVADTDTTGVLTYTDWNTFNNKQDALGFIPLNRAGDAMEGPLALAGAPTLAAHATNKSYVDNGLSTKFDKAGGTLTGPLVLAADPVQAMEPVTLQLLQSELSIISGRFAGPVDTIVELAALASNALADKQLRLVEENGTIYRYDTTSVLAGDGDGIIVPADSPAMGRWIKVQAATQNHEQLVGLQGGANGDHRHLTTAEKNSYDAHLADYSKHLTADQNDWLDAISATSAEVNYLSGVTGNIQTQLNGKQATLGFTPINKAGDNMQGPLLLAADPVQSMEAVTLQFLQNFTFDGGTY